MVAWSPLASTSTGCLVDLLYERRASGVRLPPEKHREWLLGINLKAHDRPTTDSFAVPKEGCPVDERKVCNAWAAWRMEGRDGTGREVSTSCPQLWVSSRAAGLSQQRGGSRVPSASVCPPVSNIIQPRVGRSINDQTSAAIPGNLTWIRI